MRFFFDNNLGKNLVEGMRAFGEDVVHLKEEYPQDNVPDETWLKDIGEKNYILITRDERVRWNPAELCAFRTYRVGAFLLGGKKLDKWAIIQQLIQSWPQIKNLSDSTRKPFAFRIPPYGSKMSPICLT